MQIIQATAEQQQQQRRRFLQHISQTHLHLNSKCAYFLIGFIVSLFSSDKTDGFCESSFSSVWRGGKHDIVSFSMKPIRVLIMRLHVKKEIYCL